MPNTASSKAIGSALAGAGYFLVAYGRLRHLPDMPPWGFVSLGLAGLYLLVAERVGRYRAADSDYRQALGVFALAVTGFVALAVAIELRHGWMAVAWAAQLPAIAAVARRLDIPWLRHALWPVGALVLLRLLPYPLVDSLPLGTTPIVNWLLYAYGVPFICCLAAARLLSDPGGSSLRQAGIAAAAWIGFLWLTLAIRHLFHGAVLGDDRLGLGELATYVIAWLSLGLGLLAVAGADRSVLLWAGRLALGAGVGAVAVGGLVAANPLLHHLAVGDLPIFNLLLPLYAVPAALMLAVAALLRHRGEMWPARAAGVFAVVLGFACVSLEVRQWFSGAFLDGGAPTDAETYAYSVAWLLYGIAILATGIVSGGRALRLAGLTVVAIAVGKVFLLDAAALTGLYRVASFLGLGVSLVGLGYAYQRLVFHRPAEATGP